MDDPTRRDFLMAALALTPGMLALEEPPGFPPHRSLAVHGVHAYPAEHSIAAGQTLVLHVSASVPYDLEICRLGTKMDDPEGDHVLAGFPNQPAAMHPIHPGSYVHVQKRIAGPLGGLTLECWIRPWKPLARGGILTQIDQPRPGGFGLFLLPGLELAFDLGGEHVSAAKLRGQEWQHVAACWDGRQKTLWLDGRETGRWPWAGPVELGDAPLRLAAGGEQGLAAFFLDADLALPAIHGRALSAEELARRQAERGLTIPAGQGLLACWPLTEERGDTIRDASDQERHGRIVNHATWMIGGPSLDAAVTRFGVYDPARDERRGHGLRFASDDLYDCRWPARHEWRVPADSRSGLHVARFRFEYEGKPRLYDVTFLVRRPAARPKARFLVLAATNTWRAYSGTPFAVAPPALKKVWGTGGIENAPGNPPAFNLYRAHAAGQGTYQVGLRMPWPAAGPFVLYGGPTDYSHLMRADRFLHVWLERAGHAFDVISDLDLHRDPGVLQGYRAVIINGHNEYWSIAMYQGLENYLKSGGNVVCLSGNSLFWRVSFDADGSVMESRKVDAPGMQVPANRRGEAWHSHDGRRGGMMCECGYPGWRLIALDSLGWNNQGNAANFGPYVVEDPDHFLFRRPRDLGLKKGDRIGQAGDGKVPMANGHEIDVRPSTLKALQELPDPEGARVPDDPPGIVRIANGVIPWKHGGAAFDYFFRPVKPKTDQGGEMIYWERPDGGKVFNAGSIGFGWALLADPKLQGLLENVLAHFG